MIELVYQILISIANFFFHVEVEYPYHSTDVWIHASSVGEINAISYLVNLFIEKHIPVFITTFTRSGLERARMLWGDNAQVSRFPMDKKSEIRRLVEIVNPKILIIAETELWPNLILETKGIPKFLVNARLSNKSFPKYRKFRRFFSKILKKFDWILAQTEVDRQRFIELGALPGRVKVFGSLKYDAVKRPYTVIKRSFHEYSDDDIIIIFGSIRSKEEDAVINAIEKLKKEYKNLQFIIAPRHLVRKNFIIQKLKARKIPYVLRTSRERVYRGSVLILDTLGELFDFYHIADIAFVGGTLAPYGGHSIIEPAYAGVPVIIGPHYSNMQEAAETLIREGAAIVVEDRNDLLRKLRHLIEQEDVRKRMGKKAQAIIESKTGASEKTFELILEKLKSIENSTGD